ncbi:hypothetical protein AJ85_11500 [Alkalihalobacillus alcalophilus ATCC 27647 = CGMCC 1.3604]|nr:DUF2515 family protein [Alkalihalobacillus alcalophilus]MED1563480.1 DUF2515 family protein [Alkalihalobacillus alcalophilus]THG90298.1 hypothetical protein AJ85_11500 [Alkalihalobacillus alcalophilus ATCC 27647 = CGMCC 1.3604]
MVHLSHVQKEALLSWIRTETKRHNRDNLSRTSAYLKFYRKNPEIKWSLLASAVSRNAGYNMTSLQSKRFQSLMSMKVRAHLFTFFERANWLIFADAYPQLLLYQLSKKMESPLFSLLTDLNISSFSEHEWQLFWFKKDEERLMTSLIINEQYHLQHTLIETLFAKEKILSQLPFLLEDHAHLSYVLFPTLEEKMYGVSVTNFKKVEARIELGKKLAQILYHPDCHEVIKLFLLGTEHTGSRRDYERLSKKWTTTNQTPILRLAYQEFKHQRPKITSWCLTPKQIGKFYQPVKEKKPKERTNWLKWKESELAFIYFCQFPKKIF